MKKSPKPNISPLQVEIKSEINNGYLFAMTANSRHLNLNQLLQEHFTGQFDHLTQANKFINKNQTTNENN